MAQRYFLLTTCGEAGTKFYNRIVGQFSNQTLLIDAMKRFDRDNTAYLKGTRKNLQLTNTNVALEFKRNVCDKFKDGYLIVYKNEKPFLKVAVIKMNELDENILNGYVA